MKKGFTLIELLAVIIILGILMLIAIPSITNYINNAKKSTYIDTAKELIRGASTFVNSGELDNIDSDVTYYIDTRCIANEGAKQSQSPYGKFDPAYVLMLFNDNDEYEYFFQSRDESSIGVKSITNFDDLDITKIKGDVAREDIDTGVSVGMSNKTAVIDENCNLGEIKPATSRVNKQGESTITLTYDLQGGTGTCTIESKDYLEEWGELCSPKKDGYKFRGWYSKKNGEGEEVKTSDLASKSMTVYAYWDDQYAMFDRGRVVSKKMKELAGTECNEYGTSSDSNIKMIVRSETEPIDENKQEANIISASDSPMPIYTWFDNGTIYWYTEDPNPYLNEECTYMFYYMHGLTSVDLLTVDTSKVVYLNYLFDYDTNLTSIDISTWDTSNVVYMQNMFHCCEKLADLNLGNFKTSKVVNMDSMFTHCYQLTTVDVRNWDVSKVKDMDHIFNTCSRLTSLDTSKWNLTSLTTIFRAFEDCSALRSIDVSNWGMGNVTEAYGLFWDCYNLTSLDVSKWNVSKLNSSGCMFSGCTGLTALDVSGWRMTNAGSMFSMFYNCYRIQVLDVSNWNVGTRCWEIARYALV